MIMTVEKMKQIFDTEIPYSDLIKYEGGTIFYEDEVADISIAISYEDDEDRKDVYVFNLFLSQDGYVGFDSVGIEEDKDTIIRELVDAWNQYDESNGNG